MQFFSSSRRVATVALLAASAGLSVATPEPAATTGAIPECTAVSHSSGVYYDLRPDIATPPKDGKSSKGEMNDYHAKGYDYGSNFTLNICGSVVDPVEDVVGLSSSEWADVGAYYEHEGNVFSIGQKSLDLKSHGRKLVLQYANGSPCAESKSKSKSKSSGSSKSIPRSADPDTPYPETTDSHDSYHGDHAAEEEAYLRAAEAHASQNEGDADSHDDSRRKSATFSFHCDPEQVGGQVGVSFVGTDPDECAYFFEARSQHACARAEPHQPGSVGPGSVFAIILVIAVLVYFGGGVFYQRTVAHARGWRQLPNFSLWSGIWNFICDFFSMAVSSCSRLLPRRRDYYRSLASSPSRSRRDRESENRLIDQLDEEWDD